MREDYKAKISLIEKENQKLKLEIKNLSEWVDVLTETKKKLQQRVFVLEASIRNFGISIGEDV